MPNDNQASEPTTRTLFIESLGLGTTMLVSLIGAVWFLAWLISGISTKSDLQAAEILALKELTANTYANVLELKQSNAVLGEKIQQLEKRYVQSDEFAYLTESIELPDGSIIHIPSSG